jgi:ribosomal protein L20
MTDPTFTPVTLAERSTGWTAERQRSFIETLAETGSIYDATKAVGMTRQSAYRLRRRSDAREFREAWDVALTIAASRLAAIAMDRAINGVVQDVWYKGEIVGQRRVPSDRLLMFMLRNLDPMRFGAMTKPTLYHIPNPTMTAYKALPKLTARFDDVPDGATDRTHPRVYE